eukprot:scaffold670227_cov65-Prasinocladus_malaysianus.AAC.1
MFHNDEREIAQPQQSPRQHEACEEAVRRSFSAAVLAKLCALQKHVADVVEQHNHRPYSQAAARQGKAWLDNIHVGHSYSQSPQGRKQ